MATLLLDELVRSERTFRQVTSSQEPLYANIPIERVEPDPKSKRHWMFATDNHRILAHVYRPDYVLSQFEQKVISMFASAYGTQFDITADNKRQFSKTLIQDTFTYLLFHELFHPLYLPKSRDDEERFDVALKDGIKAALPGISGRDIMNKVGNVRNSMWDFLIDIFFSHYSTDGGEYDRLIRLWREREGMEFEGHKIDALPDGIVMTWDILECVDRKSGSLFYPITRCMYSLMHCDDAALRQSNFSYFRDFMDRSINDRDLRQAVAGSFAGAVRFIEPAALAPIGIDKEKYLKMVSQLYDHLDDNEGTDARRYVLKAITDINTRLEFRYDSMRGITMPLAKYISTEKEERRDGANSEGEEGQGSGQTPTSQSGGGAEQALQSIINQNDPDANSLITQIANDHSPPDNTRNRRLTNLAIDEYYKRHAMPIPIKSPRTEATTRISGYRKVPVKVSERLLTNEEMIQLPMEDIIKFQLDTGIPCLTQISGYQWQYDQYEWQELPVRDFVFTKAGIILPDNMILRIDCSGSMTSGGGASSKNFVGTGCRYDGLMHVVYGIAKSASKAAHEMSKKVNVVVVSYSSTTRVSDVVDLEEFYDTPNNDAKVKLLSPEGSSTVHALAAYQAPYTRLDGKRTLDITVADGDLDAFQTESLAEYQRILLNKDNVVAYFPIFHQGTFALMVKGLKTRYPNLVYKPFDDLGALQRQANELVVQYSKSTGREFPSP